MRFLSLSCFNGTFYFRVKFGSPGPTGSPGKEGLIGAKVRSYCMGNVFI